MSSRQAHIDKLLAQWNDSSSQGATRQEDATEVVAGKDEPPLNGCYDSLERAAALAGDPELAEAVRKTPARYSIIDLPHRREEIHAVRRQILEELLGLRADHAVFGLLASIHDEEHYSDLLSTVIRLMMKDLPEERIPLMRERIQDLYDGHPFSRFADQLELYRRSQDPQDLKRARLYLAALPPQQRTPERLTEKVDCALDVWHLTGDARDLVHAHELVDQEESPFTQAKAQSRIANRTRSPADFRDAIARITPLLKTVEGILLLDSLIQKLVHAAHTHEPTHERLPASSFQAFVQHLRELSPRYVTDIEERVHDVVYVQMHLQEFFRTHPPSP